MEGKFKNKYKIGSIRLKNYDYSQNGFYYITICTKNKVFYFGKIINNKMVLNKYGQIVRKCWLEIPKHFPFIKLDEFIIMSNHLHGILIINKQTTKTKKFIPLQFGPQSQNLPSVIRGFKAGASKLIRQFDNNFQWQSRYYENIIDSLSELKRIRYYIKNNPRKTKNPPFITEGCHSNEC